jgi:hypothetical protein
MLKNAPKVMIDLPSNYSIVRRLVFMRYRLINYMIDAVSIEHISQENEVSRFVEGSIRLIFLVNDSSIITFN